MSRVEAEPSGIRKWVDDLAWWMWGLLALPVVGLIVMTIFAGWTPYVTIFIAILLGVALLLRCPPVQAASKPVVDFFKQLGPLVFPLVLVAIAGTVAFNWWIPVLLVPLLMAGAWYLLIEPEGTQARNAFSDSADWMRRDGGGWQQVLVGLLSLAGIALLVYGWFRLRGDLSAQDGQPEFTGDLVSGAVVVWIVALFLRLLGYATSLWRLFAALIVVLAAGRLLMAAGLIPGNKWLVDLAEKGRVGREIEEVGNWLLAAGLAIGLIALVDAVANLVPRFRKAPERGALDSDGAAAKTLSGLGFATASLATLVLGLAALIAVIDSESGGKEGVTPEDEVIQPGTAIPPDELDDPTLAETYAPVLVFTDGERWAPSDAMDFVADAELVRANGSTQDPAVLKRRCPRLVSVPCYQLRLKADDCETGSDPCAEGRYREEEHYTGGEDEPIYVRVLRKGRPEPGNSPNAFTGAGFYRDLPAVLVQYWFFYRYNEWTRPVLGGRINQRHEGDWEAVMVGLGGEGPLFVAYSSHCGGSWQKWGKAEVADTEERPRLHPLIAVAEGSHANYLKTDDRRAPDWAACKGVPGGSTTALSYASNLRDETEYGWDWRATRLEPVDPTVPPMSFPGTWGGNDYTELANERSQRFGEEGKGPKTPTLQDLWRTPIKTVFCSEHWHGPEPCN